MSEPAVPDLKRWERREFGQELRRLGLSFREIARVIPVNKSTLSGWCRGVSLTEGQRKALDERTGAPAGHHRGARTNRHRRIVEVTQIRADALREAPALARSNLWLAGVMLYWAEGTKGKGVRLANSDPELIRVAMRWFRHSLRVSDDRFTLRLHLHSSQSEEETKLFWAEIAGLPLTQFGKTFWKQEGSGHRKNVLYRGTIQVAVKRSGDLLHRIRAWIEACYHLGGPLAKLVIAADS